MTGSMKTRTLVGVLSVIVFVFCTGTATAEIYKCVDAGGRITYSNVQVKGCKKLDLEPLTTVPATKARASRPADFPKVDAKTQKERDAERRKILEKELADEEKLLADVKKEYNDGQPERQGDERNYQKYLDRVKRLKDEIGVHEANVGALKHELSVLKD